jgi:transposase-like protein
MGYIGDWMQVDSDFPCPKCESSHTIECIEWESSCGGYEDYHYRCISCGHDWWIEGADA